MAAAQAIMTVEDPLDRQRERERRRDKKLKRKVGQILVLDLSLLPSENANILDMKTPFPGL